MDMQQMSMGSQGIMPNMHDTFWRDDQVTVLLQSDQSLVVDGMLSREPIQDLGLPTLPQKLSKFLQDNKIPVTLHFLDDSDQSGPDQPPPPQIISSRSGQLDDLGLPPGVYAFGFRSPLDSEFGLIRTSVISFLRIEKAASHKGGADMAMAAMPGAGNDGGDDGNSDSVGALIPSIVKAFNENLEELNRIRQIPVTIAMPTWLSGSTGGIGQGCPLTPPVPVEGDCSNWHYELRDLSSDLQSTTGKGVTVFVLDAFPERGVIARAARDAGDDNRLLKSINEAVTFDYSYMSGVQDVQEMGDTKGTFVGKDVYGRHYPILLADHGLFVAGITHDLAPDAHIECVRVLDDLCVGDVNFIVNALKDIYFRKALSAGDLYGKPVVVNLSLVIPTDDEANTQGVNTAIGGANNVWSSLKQPLQGLSQLGVIIAASAGNEGDLREMPAGADRPNVLYPAGFVYEPYNVDGIIPVGAVKASGDPASYSCYPGLKGLATYGGEVPGVTPKDPPSSDPKLSYPLDAPRGIYSSVEYAPLSSDPPEQYYSTPNDHAWAYWVGTSFASPIISALAARVFELEELSLLTTSVRQAIFDAASATTKWDRVAGAGGGLVPGNMLKAVQYCAARDRDEDEDDEVEVNIQIIEIENDSGA